MGSKQGNNQNFNGIKMIKIAFIIIFFVGISTILRIWYLFKNEKISIKNAIFWTVLWIIVGIGILVPDSIDLAMKIFGMENRLFFISIFGIFILLIGGYNLSISQKKTERTVAKLVQEITILNYKLDREKEMALFKEKKMEEE